MQGDHPRHRRLGRVYQVTSNSYECTGDGLALAYRAGAELMDMEMIQFHPTGMIYPEGVRGLLVTEAVRGEGGILTNVKGERFMERYDPKRKELSARDVVARSIYTEIVEGRGTANGAVYLDITQRGPEYIKKKLPSMYSQFLEFAGVDITKQKMEVAPTVHYQMGGVQGRAGDRGHERSRASTRRGRSRAGCTGRTGSAGTPWATYWSSGGGRASPRREYCKANASGEVVGARTSPTETSADTCALQVTRTGPTRSRSREDRGGDVEVRGNRAQRGGPEQQGSSEILAIGEEAEEGGGEGTQGRTTSPGSTRSRSGTWCWTARVIIRSAHEPKGEQGRAHAFRLSRTRTTSTGS